MLWLKFLKIDFYYKELTPTKEKQQKFAAAMVFQTGFVKPLIEFFQQCLTEEIHVLSLLLIQEKKKKTKQLTYMMVSAVAVVSFSAYLSSCLILK